MKITQELSDLIVYCIPIPIPLDIEKGWQIAFKFVSSKNSATDVRAAFQGTLLCSVRLQVIL